ncbi:MAG: hypothetical protein L6V93_20795 [Clostridiales bacterium]|nr:MAG: hypothetical protein L6V93_20795 [Clostridiales bacterium]
MILKIDEIKTKRRNRPFRCAVWVQTTLWRFYGLRIDNGEVSYPNGYDTIAISTAQDGSETLKKFRRANGTT